MGSFMLSELATAAAQLIEKNPQLFRTIWLMAKGAVNNKNPWRYALRTIMAEAAMHAGQELADEILKARQSMKL